MPEHDAKEIAETLAWEIETKIHPIGSCLPTRHELAQRFGVARGTVDRAVRELGNRGMVRSYRRAGSLVVNTSRVLRFAMVNGSAVDAAMENRSGIACTAIPRLMVETQSDLERLFSFDGILWHLPTEAQMEWAGHQGRIPQIIVNREPPAMDYVSTDHAGAVYQITSERLGNCPGWRPVFLDTDGNPAPAVVALRREGFIRACREHDVFYDLITLPDGFGDRLAMLRSRLGSAVGTPLLVVSASLQHTGAFMAWAHESSRRWREDLLYTDFDNDYGAHVWGVTVTSLLQDYAGLRTAAVQGLVDLIHRKVERVQLLQPALRRDGET